MSKELETVDLPVVQATPMEMLSTALAGGTSPDELGKLFDLQERWEASEAKKAYIIAMSGFQADCPLIEKLHKAHNSNYANLPDTLKQIKSLMKEHGFSHSWKTEQADGQITVTCGVTHIGGHQEYTSMTAGADTSGSKNAVQAIGSTNTYLQRYTLFSVLGLASEEQDTDGEIMSDPITQEMHDALLAEIDNRVVDKIRFIKAFKVDDIHDLTMKDYPKAMKGILGKPLKDAEK